MVVQFEDVIDVLNLMHPTHNFLFLFRHSAGHAKQRPDGLNQHRMNQSFGGKTSPMHITIISQEKGYLGAFPRILEPGDTQDLVFTSSDNGPFWMSSEEREQTQLDNQLGTLTAIKLKTAELIARLSENGLKNTIHLNARQLRELCAQRGIPTIKRVSNLLERNRSDLELELKGRGVTTKGKNKRELDLLCKQHHISTMKINEKIKEGSQAKGLLQVLWERGLIDGSKSKHYLLIGKKDDLGTVDNSTSLRHIMGMCHNFLNEEGMLQHIAKNLGVTVLLTPNCHAELAGKGVEYVWACAKKGTSRSLTLKQKRGKDNFKASISPLPVGRSDNQGENSKICKASKTVFDGVSRHRYTSG